MEICKGAIVSISIGDLGGISLISLIILYRYWRDPGCEDKESTKEESTSGGRGRGLFFFRRKDDSKVYTNNMEQANLIALDGQVSYDLDEILRAFAFVLGKSGVGIVYKVMLE